MLGLSGQAFGTGVHSVTLTWDANTEPDIAGYILRYGTATHVYSHAVDVGNTTTLVIPDLATDTTVIYFQVSAYTAAGLEGPASLETNSNPGDTTLASLALSAGMLEVPLTGGTDVYTVYVSDTTTSVALAPTTQDSAATVAVNGVNIAQGGSSQGITLNLGASTSITIVVTAKDGITTKTYYVVITPLTPIEMWRNSYFGSPANAGLAADTAIPQKDGITNLMKFATLLDPTRRAKMPGTLTKGSTTLTFKYSRSVAAVSGGVTYAVEWSDTMGAGTWTRTGVSETTVIQGDEVKVTATLPAGANKRRFVRLVVTAP